MPPKIFKTQTRVRYAETDASGIVYYNNYFVYFEIGRIEMFRELHLPYDHRLPIAESYAEYHDSAEFDDMLEIHSFVAEVRRAGFRIGCQVYRLLENDEKLLLVSGYTAMVTVDDNRKPTTLSPAFKTALANIT